MKRSAQTCAVHELIDAEASKCHAKTASPRVPTAAGLGSSRPTTAAKSTTLSTTVAVVIAITANMCPSWSTWVVLPTTRMTAIVPTVEMTKSRTRSRSNVDSGNDVRSESMAPGKIPASFAEACSHGKVRMRTIQAAGQHQLFMSHLQ